MNFSNEFCKDYRNLSYQFNIFLFYLFIYLFVYYLFYLFIYLFIYLWLALLASFYICESFLMNQILDFSYKLYGKRMKLEVVAIIAQW